MAQKLSKASLSYYVEGNMTTKQKKTGLRQDVAHFFRLLELTSSKQRAEEALILLLAGGGSVVVMFLHCPYTAVRDNLLVIILSADPSVGSRCLSAEMTLLVAVE